MVMPRISEEIFDVTPPPNFSFKKRFSDILKRSIRSSKSSVKKFFHAILTKDNVQPSSPAGHNMNFEDITISTTVDTEVNPSDGTRAEDMIGEWQAEFGREQAQNHEMSMGAGRQRGVWEKGSEGMMETGIPVVEEYIDATGVIVQGNLSDGDASDIDETGEGTSDPQDNKNMVNTFTKADEILVDDHDVEYDKKTSQDGHLANADKSVDDRNSIITEHFMPEASSPFDIFEDDHLDAADENADDRSSVITEHLGSENHSPHDIFQELYEQGVATPAGVQFYVNRKIQEALQAHEQKFHKPIPLPPQPVALPTSLKLGPFFITDSILIAVARWLSAWIYMSALFCAALQGPKEFFLAVWFLAVYAGTYRIILHELGWNDGHVPDFFLEPVYHGVDLMASMSKYASQHIGLFLGPIIGGIVRGILDADEAREVESTD